MSIPDWAPFDDPGDWETFAALVREDAQRRGWEMDVEAGQGRAGRLRIGLENLARICAGEPRAAWPELIGTHFHLGEGFNRPIAFADAGEARAAMRARLVQDAGDEHVGRRVGDDLHVVIAFDFPDRVAMPGRDEVLRWGDEDELLALALAQTRAEPGLQLDRHDVDGGLLLALIGDSFFTATHALWAEELDPPGAEHGTLVAVPTRHLVLAHPIRDDRMIGMLMPMLRLAIQYCRQGPGSVSEALYWLRDGYLERLDAWLDEEDELSIAPSPAFSAMIASLSGSRPPDSSP